MQLKDLASSQHRLCSSSLATFFLLFLGLIFLPYTWLPSFFVFASLAAWQFYRVLRLTQALLLSLTKRLLYLIGFSIPLVPAAVIGMHPHPETGLRVLFSPLSIDVLDVLAVTCLISAAFLVTLNSAAIRKLRDHGWNVSFLGTTLSRRL